MESKLISRPAGETDAASGARAVSPRLSEIDRQVLRLVAQGRSSKEIAQELGRSPLTIDSRLKDVCAKLGAENRVQAATMLLLEESGDTPPELGGPQSWRIAKTDAAPPHVHEDGVPCVAGPSSEPEEAMSPSEVAPAPRSLIRVVGAVLGLLIVMACVAFFLASAILAGQEVFIRMRG